MLSQSRTFPESLQIAGEARKIVLQMILRQRSPTMKTKITLKIDADVLRETRTLAAEQGLSVSALLAAKLDEIVGRRKGYDRARKRALARLRNGLEMGWARPLSRDELHAR